MISTSIAQISLFLEQLGNRRHLHTGYLNNQVSASL